MFIALTLHVGIKAGVDVGSGQYTNWRPGEYVPHGEMYSDTD